LISFFQALAENPFLRFAIIAGIASSFASGIIGSLVVVKRIVSISGSIAHSVLGGMGLCVFLADRFGWHFLLPLHGAIVAGLLSALLIGWIHMRYREREDTVIALIWATGMSLGVIFLALTPGYNIELLNFLFGNILWVSRQDILFLLSLDLLLLTSVALFYPRFLAICFDEEQAALQGLRVQSLYLFLLCLVALSVVLLIQIVGAILVIAMLAIPAAIATTFTFRLSTMMLIATGLGILLNFFGMYISYTWNWPSGATISLLAALAYMLSLLRKKRTA
jgi:zinc transport system permease protein